jgi:hypothetical protein
MVTTRKIRRNFVRWFFRPFWKPKKKVAVDLPAPNIPRPTRTLSELEHFYLKANGGYLMPIIPDFGQYAALFPAGTADSNHDLIAVMFGTTSQLLTHFYDFITYQNPDTNSTAVLISGTSTPSDAEALASRAREQAYWVRKSHPTRYGYTYLDNPPSFRFITDMVGNIASTGGNGGNQRTALRNLQTDPFTVPDILEVLRVGCRAFLDYKPKGCALFTAQGGGGTDTYHRYAVAAVKEKLPVNRHYILYLLPTKHEPLHVPNMKGTLAYELEREAHELKAAEEEKQLPTTLHFLFQQKTTGAHKSDRAMIARFITLTGASRGRLNGGIDPTTKFNLMATLAGTWLTVNPVVVPLPLVPMGKVEMVDGTRHEEHYKVSLTETQGGQRIHPIVSAIETLVAEDPAAPHFITLASYMHEEEMVYIRDGVARFPLQPGGEVHLYFNTCYPTFNRDDDTAEALLCDFRGGKGVQELLHTFLQEKQPTPLTNGFSWTDRLALAGNVPERFQTEEIEQGVQEILTVDHLE